MPAELGQHAPYGGVKERNIPHVRAHRFGLGQLLRGRVRPMAGDTPSGYGLTGQSGLVFHVDLMPAPGARGAPGEVVPPLCRG